jgi:competence protein ComEC
VSDREVIGLAIAVWIGALLTWRAPLAPVVVLALIVWLARRPRLLIACAAALASVLAAHALDGLRPPAPAVVQAQWVTLLTDPAPASAGSVGVEVRLGRRHVQAFARGPAAGALTSRLAGEHVRVDGVLRPLSDGQRGRLLPRHIVARLSIDAVTGVRPANAIGQAANAFRRVVFRGAEALPEGLRPLFGGMVLGDDRGQSVELADAFRAAGLTHLLVVSGENVAFALLVAAPLLRRGRLWWRFAATIAVLVAFGTLTRWEPSVLRAEAMAAVAAAGALVGRPVPAARLLALAVAGCVLVDPLLVRSVGFRLSVAACAGLILLTRPLQRRGVPMLLAASVGAQLGASLVLVPTFGTVPLVSLPANVLAVPVAGPLMMWGLTAGTVAGALPALAPLLHAPTHLALAWEAGVATRAAALPIAPIGALAAAAVGVAVVLAMMHRRLVAPAALTLLVVVALAMRGPAAASGSEVGPGMQLWSVRGRTVLVVGGQPSATALDALRARRLHRLDVLVVARPGTSAADAARPLIAAFHPRVVLAPESHQVAGAYTARLGATVVIGDVEIRVADAGPPLRVRVTRVEYGATRDPPPR